MIVSGTGYSLIVVSEDGTQYDISDFAEGLSWEENKGELATRITFSIANESEDLKEILKIGCLAAVLYDDEEVIRGYINEATEKYSNTMDLLTFIAYDELIALQKSKDQMYFTEGQTTQQVLMQIFNDWGIPAGQYTGANVTHGKLVYKTGSLADCILDILDDAHKKGGAKTIIRANQGVIDVIARGSNETVFGFDESNTVSATKTESITDIVTRVKIIGKTTDEGRPPVEAVLNGHTEFGVRQEIYLREKDTTASDAQKAAQEILDERGKTSKSQSVTLPDVPSIRKGDAVELDLGDLQGAYYVAGIRHEADTGIMIIELEEG